MHLLENPDDSVATLDISDALLLDVIWAGAYTVSELDELLQGNKFRASDLLPTALRNRNAEFRLLKCAVKQWKLQHSTV